MRGMISWTLMCRKGVLNCVVTNLRFLAQSVGQSEGE